MDKKYKDRITGGVFLIGIAALGISGLWWPGILVVLGITSLVSGLLEGRLWKSASGAFWLIGLALIFYLNWPWWLLIALTGVGLIIGAHRDRSSGREVPEWAQRLTAWGERMQEHAGAEKEKRKNEESSSA